MEPRKAFLASPFSLLLMIFLLLTVSLYVEKVSSEEHRVTPHKGPLVEKSQRRTLYDTDYGEISAVDVSDGHRAPLHHLQFITLDPNSLFLPVLLHADMVFYVQTGNGRLTWADEHGDNRINLLEGDVCKLNEGSVFYIQSSLESDRKKLRIYAMFANKDDNTYDPSIGAYSRINQLVKGFDKKIIQAAFKVPEDLVEAITNKTDTPAIVHAASEKHHSNFWELEALFLRNFIEIQSNSKKVKTYNVFKHDPDFKNCNGWTLTVTKKQLKTLKDTNIGFLMVNLTQGSMLGPHWNPRATEIAVVLQGEGMVRVVCGSNNDNKTNNAAECKNMRFRVKEGDVFVVPRYHPMAQMSFNNDSLVFIGFSTASKENHPQFLAGKTSLLRVLDRDILATSLGVSNATVDKLLGSQDESIIFECVSCAEEEEEEEEEEEGKGGEEEEEEEAERRKREEAAKRERERRRQEEEAEREREEEERAAEEAAQREREQARKEREEEEAARREKERARQEEEAEREAARREQERARREKQAEREQEEEEAAAEAAAQREQERAKRERQEEEAAAREAAQREQERGREEQERTRQEEESEREQEEEEAAAAEAARREQERARREEQERERGRRSQEEEEEEAPEWEWEQQEARREQQERERRRQHGRGRRVFNY